MNKGRAVAWCCVVLLGLWVGGCPAKPPGTGDGEVLSDGGVIGEAVGGEASPVELRSESPTPDRGSGTEPRPEPRAEPRPEPRAEPRPEPTAEPRAEPSPDAGAPEPRPEVSPEPRADGSSPDKAADTIGNPCTTDADCGGAPNKCVPAGKPPQFPFPQTGGKGPPGGYCTRPCFVGSAACGSHADCYVPGAASGACMKTCTQDSDCRQAEGYKCSGNTGTGKKVCFPPSCSLVEPSGNYWATVNSASTKGTCTQKPAASGTRFPMSVASSGGQISFTFGSKPLSPLPVTWTLEGTNTSSGKILASRPKGCSTCCSSTCEGLIDTSVHQNACVFYGTLYVRIDANCTHVYDMVFSKR